MIYPFRSGKSKDLLRWGMEFRHWRLSLHSSCAVECSPKAFWIGTSNIFSLNNSKKNTQHS